MKFTHAHLLNKGNSPLSRAALLKFSPFFACVLFFSVCFTVSCLTPKQRFLIEISSSLLFQNIEVTLHRVSIQ